jgi:hypothetical protein
MTDAPETIWAVSDVNISAQITDVYAQNTPDGFVDKPTEYTRTDISQARFAELETRNGKLGDAVAYATQKFTHQEARISQLEGALGSLQGWAQSKPHPAGETPREYHLHAIICEALTALKAKP